jgi:hypothetical protein
MDSNADVIQSKVLVLKTEVRKINPHIFLG